MILSRTVSFIIFSLSSRVLCLCLMDLILLYEMLDLTEMGCTIIALLLRLVRHLFIFLPVLFEVLFFIVLLSFEALLTVVP